MLNPDKTKFIINKTLRFDKVFVDLLKHSQEIIVESLTYLFNFM